jgi:hypothetical protein
MIHWPGFHRLPVNDRLADVAELLIDGVRE